MKPRSRRYIAKKKITHAISWKEAFEMANDRFFTKAKSINFPTKEEMEQHWNSLSFPPTKFYRDNYPFIEMMKGSFCADQPQDVTMLDGIPYKTTTLEIKGND